MSCQDKNRLTLQFHITGRCNLRCKHCYRTEGDIETLSFDDIKAVIDSVRELRKSYNAAHGIKKRAHINLTGGEPFFREDITDIIKYIAKYSKELTYAVLTNGPFINDEIIALLKETRVSFVQLSLDGKRKSHDFLRAKGDYKRVLKTARLLESNGIRTHISFTANRSNYKDIPAVARACRRNGITKLWSDRLVPIGNAKELEELKITKEIFPDYVKMLTKAKGNVFTRFFYPKTQVTLNRALQFIDSDGSVYSCSAGKSLITVDEFGRIMPCRRMPIICGDIKTADISEVYYGSEVFRRLRDERIPKECLNCAYNCFCVGGAKCQSFAEYGDFSKADPVCALKMKI